jgi:sulfofructose kinase
MDGFFACVGHAAVDHHFEIVRFPEHPTKTSAHRYHMIAGGMAANAAMAMARLGERVHLIGRIGDDEPGRFVRGALDALGVTTRLETVAQASTSVSSVVVDSQGERQITTHRGDALPKAHALDSRQLTGARAVLTDPRWSEGASAALAWARAQGVAPSGQQRVMSMLDADIAPREVLQRLVPLAQWAVFSQGGLATYAPGASREEGLRMALRAGAQVAMVTLGEHGVLWTHGDEVFAQEAFKVQALDTTGAGDVFHAALLIALSWPEFARDERSAVRFACAAAAIKCTRRLGALHAPSRAEVQNLLSKS